MSESEPEPEPEHDYDYSEVFLSNNTNLWNKLDNGNIALICLLFTPTVVMATFGNIYLIYVMLVTPSLRTATNFFVSNMAVSNLLLVLVCSPIFIIRYSFQNYIMGRHICNLEGALQVGFMLASGLSIVVISIDRFRGIVYPFRERLSNRCGLIIIAFIWIAAIVFSIPLMIIRQYEERQWADYLEKFCGEDVTRSKTYWTVVLVAVVYIPVSAVTIAYIFIIVQLEKYESRVRNREHPSKARNRRKVARMLFIILMVHFFCWIPFEVVVIYRNYFKGAHASVSEWQRNFSFVAHYLAYTNGASNPFIYGASNGNYRKAFFKKFPFLRKTNRVVPTPVIPSTNVDIQRSAVVDRKGTRSTQLSTLQTCRPEAGCSHSSDPKSKKSKNVTLVEPISTKIDAPD